MNATIKELRRLRKRLPGPGPLTYTAVYPAQDERERQESDAQPSERGYVCMYVCMYVCVCVASQVFYLNGSLKFECCIIMLCSPSQTQKYARTSSKFHVCTSIHMQVKMPTNPTVCRSGPD